MGEKYKLAKPKLTSGIYYVKGAKWWDKTYGNTYNSCKIYKDGKQIAFLGISYGYGDMYMQRAREYVRLNLRKNAKAQFVDMGAAYMLKREVKEGWF